MSNMSYCRFQNTLRDLHDCYAHMDDEDLSDDERWARAQLLKVCLDIVGDYGDPLDGE